MEPSCKFRCDICNQDFLYQTDLIKHINAHMARPPTCSRVSVITHTSSVQELSSSDAACMSSGESSGISMVNQIPTSSQKKSTSPKNGHKSSEPKHMCTPTKTPDVSKQTHTPNVQIVSPEKTSCGRSEGIGSIPKETEAATTSKGKSKSSNKGKSRSKSSKKSLDSSDCVIAKEFFCQFCRKHFDSKLDLQQHFELTHKVDTPFKCILCKSEYQKEYTLCLHERDHHANNIFYKCPKCSSRFITEIGLLNHKCNTKQKQKNTLANTNLGPGSSGEIN